MAVRLPVQLEDPVDQLLEIIEDTKVAKEMQSAIGADMLRTSPSSPRRSCSTGPCGSTRSWNLADRHGPCRTWSSRTSPARRSRCRRPGRR